MQFCHEHWQALRTAIKDRGLWHLVSPNAEELARRQGTDGFDPLFMAHNAIVENLLDAGGILALQDGCALCAAIAGCGCGKADCSYTTWITRAADDALALARERGLVTSQ